MLHRGGLEVYTNNNYQFCSVKVYTGSAWVTAVPYIYTSNTWTKLGAAGTVLDYFYDSNNQLFNTSNSGELLVRRL